MGKLKTRQGDKRDEGIRTKNTHRIACELFKEGQSSFGVKSHTLVGEFCLLLGDVPSTFVEYALRKKLYEPGVSGVNM
jgi:hypothetical protein